MVKSDQFECHMWICLHLFAAYLRHISIQIRQTHLFISFGEVITYGRPKQAVDKQYIYNSTYLFIHSVPASDMVIALVCPKVKECTFINTHIIMMFVFVN